MVLQAGSAAVLSAGESTLIDCARAVTELFDIAEQQFGIGLQQAGAITGDARPQPELHCDRQPHPGRVP